MTKRFHYPINLFVITLFIFGICIQNGSAQTDSLVVKGSVVESGSGTPLKQVLISVSSTGVSTQTDSLGTYIITVPDKNAELNIEFPGYIKRKMFTHGRDIINITLVSSDFKSLDNNYNSPFGVSGMKDETYAISILNASDMDITRSTNFDQEIQGKVSGLRVIEHSGVANNRTWMNIRGVSSMFGKNEPLLFVDGMIHDYNYTNLDLMEGFALNTLDIVDIEDISDITVMKNGLSYLGGAGSNGIININTEQKSEASTVIKITAHYGVTLMPKSLEVLNASEFTDYLNQYQAENNVSLNLNDPYKYSNSTDWQNEIYSLGKLSKIRLFIKGGDEIATYNISTGFIKQDDIYSKSYFDRFNLRINGKINITDKFSVAPNAKLSLADSYLPNQGYSAYKNPIISAVTMPPVMGVYQRDPSTGVQLPYIDDVGAFNVSNPVAIVRNAVGSNRNYNFLSSVNAQYRVNSHLLISNLTGIDFNSTRESIFIPDLGIISIDSANNSPQDFACEYRSTQNHTTINYSLQNTTGSSLEINAGLRYMKNTYKNVKLIDLNTASDYLKNLGTGSGPVKYLRSSNGDDRGFLWLSYFLTANYSYMNKYFINANISYDGNSATSKKNRYNFYPSLGAAWRVISPSQNNLVEDLKFRASFSQTGNIFSEVYDYSKLFYIDTRYTIPGNTAATGVLTRETIPNENIEVEKKTTINAGVDISLYAQTLNIHIDYYVSNVNNLIIKQRLQDSYGYINYYDNGGKLTNSGIELSFDKRLHLSNVTLILGGTFAMNANEVSNMKFINPTQDRITTEVPGAELSGVEYVTRTGYSINSFYGYKTNGIYNDIEEANGITGPKGKTMQRGDIRFVDFDQNGIINENDKTIIGNPNPDFFGGFSSSIHYKRFELSAFLTYSIGNDAFNYLRYKAESMDDFNNQFKTVLNRWTSSNTEGTMPRASYNDPTGNTVFSDRWIEDASYVRLKKVSINYSIPRFYKGLTFFISASNLLTFTKYTGYDPEFMNMSDPFSMGIDSGSIPQTRSFIAGIKLGL